MDRAGIVSGHRPGSEVALMRRSYREETQPSLRDPMRKIADSKPYRVPASIDEPAVLEELRTALQILGYAR